MTGRASIPSAARASKTRTKRLFCAVASRRAAASPRERMAIFFGREVFEREACRSVSMRKLHEWRAAQSLDRGLTGSLLCPHAVILCEMVFALQGVLGAQRRRRYYRVQRGT